MLRYKLRQKLKIIILILGLFSPLSYVLAGTVLSSHKYAWSNNVGYINFEHVIVSDSALSGYAWSANKGFINFSPAQGGVLNDGTGNLSGSAWGEQLGWIDFNNTSIDANGKFSGTASGDLVGTITFDCPNFCDVQTDWRPTFFTPPPFTPPPGNSGSGGGNQGRPVVIVNTVNVAPQSLNQNVILDIVREAQTSNAIKSTEALPITNKGGGPASLISALTQKFPLFDVISEPVQTARANPVSFIIFSIIAEISIILLLVFFMRWITVYLIKRRGRK